MRNFLLAFTALAVTSTVSSSSFAADERNVTVINGTGYGVNFLSFNNPGDDDWSDNELASNSVFPHGNSVFGEIQYRTKTASGISRSSSPIPANVDLCHINSPTLKVRPSQRHDHLPRSKATRTGQVGPDDSRKTGRASGSFIFRAAKFACSSARAAKPRMTLFAPDGETGGNALI